MSISEQEIDYLEKHVPELADATVKQTYWRALASGSSVLVSENGEIREVFPDGSYKVIKQNSPFIKVQKGQFIRSK